MPTSAATATGFSRYSFGDELGRGGLGVVRLAEDLSLRRELAVKTLLRPDQDSTAAFVEEAQITGQLEHPNIVPVHELGFDPHGRPYLAMKLVQGRTLRNEINRVHHLIEDGAPEGEIQLEERRLLEILAKVCEAVGYAHSRGVIHRDLKPDNVMTGEFGEVLVMDWGLARPYVESDATSRADRMPASTSERRRVTSDRRQDSPDLTVDGDVFGTPAYMSPEQAGGWVNRIGPATDIYALGAILYSILTAEAPYSAPTSMQVLIDVQNGKLVPPSERDTGRVVPRELEAVTLRAMAHDPADRYASALELREDIMRYLGGRALTAADYSSWQLAWKWAMRHKVAVAGALSTAAAIILGLVAVIVMRDQAREAELEKQRVRAVAFVQAAHDLLPQAQPVHFNPAAPQDYYRSWLPLMLKLGQAIQTHPDPVPDEWRTELDGYCVALQANAISIGDWGMAGHVAESARAWGALTDDMAGAARLAQVESARQERIVADRQRLQQVLDRIREVETGTPPEGSFWQVPGPRRLSSQHELPDRARRLISRVRKDPTATTAAVMTRLNETANRDDGPTLVQRLFLINLLGQLMDMHTRVDGRTAVDMTIDHLNAPFDPMHADEYAHWMETATRFDSRSGNVISERLGQPLKEFFEDRIRETGSISLANMWSATKIANDLNRGMLPDLEGNTTDLIHRLSQLEVWLLSTVQSGSDYTRTLLDALDGVDAHGNPLTDRQRVFVVDQIGRYADGGSPDSSRPDRNAPQMLTKLLSEVPADDVTGRNPAPANQLALSIVLINALHRLEHRDAAPLICRLLVRSGDHGHLSCYCRTAGQLLEWPANLVPTDVEGFLARALSNRMAGRVSDGIDGLTAGLRNFPDDVGLLAARSQLYLFQDKSDAALRDADRAVEVHPDDPRSWTARGLVREYQHQPDDAIAACDQALAADPEHVPALLQRGQALISLRQFMPALTSINRAIKLQPLLASAWHARGVAHYRMNMVEDAVRDFAQAEAIYPGFARAIAARAACEQHLGRTDEALIDSMRSLVQDPTCVSGWMSRAQAYTEIKVFPAAAADFTRALQFDGEQVVALHNRGIAWLNQEKWQQAEADFVRVTELLPNHWQAWAMRGLTSAKLGRTMTAATCFDRAMDEAPPQARAIVLKYRRQALGD